MKLIKTIFLRQIFLGALFLALPQAVWGVAVRTPHISYLYPAGGQQGNVVTITLGGQFLRHPKQLFISGSGVSGEIIKYIRPPYRLNREQRNELIARLKKVCDKDLATLSSKERKAVLDKFKLLRKRQPRKSRKPQLKAKSAKEPPQPSDTNKKAVKKTAKNFGGRRRADHPLLMDLEHKSLRELLHITKIIFPDRRKKQKNRQLGEMVVVKITIAKAAKPGNRELRLLTNAGLTNPVIFQVGTVPEFAELEPNNSVQAANLPEPLKIPPLELPILINGQIMPGDIDEFKFYAKKDAKLVIKVSARALIPYLADAVPGWFQATLALYDSQGKEIAYADDYYFNPDPIIFYKIPKDGIYRLKIRDAIYRGREDFVYRISIAESPFITQIFPLGGRAGIKTTATMFGWNLLEQQLSLNTALSNQAFRETAYTKAGQSSNQIPYAVGLLPEITEQEPNNSLNNANQIALPVTINGRIAHPGDSDLFKFTGKAGDDIVAEVYARRLNSPLDSLLQLLDRNGKVIAWNDDFVHQEKYLHIARFGLITHHADSYLTAKLPAAGTYYIKLTDTQHHGSKAYGYRLRISHPLPDFVLFTTPSSITLRSGIPHAIKVYLLRRDGFNGAVKVSLATKNRAFEITGGVIPPGKNSIRMTLTALNKGAKEPFKLQLIGTATIAGEKFRHQAIPADNVMQAFLYRHLLPAKQLAVYVRPQKWQVNAIALLTKTPVKIPLNGNVEVKIKFGWGKYLKSLEFELAQPPAGITLSNVRFLPQHQGIAFDLHADGKKLKPGVTDNLIIAIIRKFTHKKTKKISRHHVGSLPAIPIEIIAAKNIQSK